MKILVTGSETISLEAIAAAYRAQTGGTVQWLNYHLAEGGITPFGARLLDALVVCDARLPGSAERYIRELADIRYIATETDPAAWRRGYEQMISKLAEILVTRVVFEAQWPEGTTFAIEPTNPATGGRPDLAVTTPDRQWLFELKCPSFIDHQARRAASGQQLLVRGPMGEIGEIREAATLPRDNTLKDCLESAQIVTSSRRRRRSAIPLPVC